MNEIEEFLRRAAQRAQQAQQGQRQRPPAAPPPVIYPQEIMDAEVVDVEPVSGDDVAEEVRRRLDTRRFQQRAKGLAEHVRLADDVIEAHLQQAFEHRLGQLGAVTSATEQSTLDEEEIQAAKAKQPPSEPLEIRSLLKSSDQVRNAIVLGEILRRPEERW